MHDCKGLVMEEGLGWAVGHAAIWLFTSSPKSCVLSLKLTLLFLLIRGSG
jgi:hypothetical protein